MLCTASAGEEDQLMKRKLGRAQLLWHIIVVTTSCSTSVVISAMYPGVNNIVFTVYPGLYLVMILFQFTFYLYSVVLCCKLDRYFRY